jgi:hypothetical protein
VITRDTLDALWPDRHAEAERLNLHPSLRAGFVPSGPLTDAQRDVLFPAARRVPVMRSIVEAVGLKESA